MGGEGFYGVDEVPTMHEFSLFIPCFTIPFLIRFPLSPQIRIELEKVAKCNRPNLREEGEQVVF